MLVIEKRLEVMCRILFGCLQVRTDKSVRGLGVGKAMLEWAINKAKNQGCHVVQLTTDKKRPEALEFYKKLGFKASHEGMKLYI